MALCIFLPCCRGLRTAKPTDVAIAARNTRFPIVRLWWYPWEDAGRAAQSHQPGAGQKKMHRDEVNRDQKGRKEGSWWTKTQQSGMLGREQETLDFLACALQLNRLLAFLTGSHMAY